MNPSIDPLEAVEIEAWRDLVEALPTRDARALGLGVVTTAAGASAFHCERGGGLLLNRVVGLGPRAARDDAALEEAVAPYAARGITRFFVQPAGGPADDAFEARLARLGLERYRRAWVKLVRLRGAPLPPPVPSPLEVREARPDDADAFAALLADGFDFAPEAAPFWRGMVGRPGWVALLAVDGRTPVAAAGLYVSRRLGLGYLAGAATAPAHRRRGAQALLVRERLARADALGLARVATETGESVPGDPQHSYRNLARHGFVEVAVRPNYAPRGTRWGHGVTRAVL